MYEERNYLFGHGGLDFFDDITSNYRDRLIEWVRQNELSESWVMRIYVEDREVIVSVSLFKFTVEGRPARFADPRNPYEIAMQEFVFPREDFPKPGPADFLRKTDTTN